VAEGEEDGELLEGWEELCWLREEDLEGGRTFGIRNGEESETEVGGYSHLAWGARGKGTDKPRSIPVDKGLGASPARACATGDVEF
jgi:hypothetical protein